MSSHTGSPTSSSHPTAAASGDDLCHAHHHHEKDDRDVEVDEMTAMFSNLLKGGLIKQADLIDNGFHDVSTKIMVDVSVNSDVGRAVAASRATRRQQDEANATHMKSPTHEVRRTIGKGRGRADDGDENIHEKVCLPLNKSHHPNHI